jgi:hypothetical protein
MRGPESFVLAAGSVIMRFARHRTCQSEAPTTGADMTPQFRSGQTVRLSRGLPYKSAADGDYKIVRQLPDNGGEQQYRIKSVREPHERVVKESDLEKVWVSPGTGPRVHQEWQAMDLGNLLSAGRSNAGGGMDQETELTLKIRMDRKKYAWSLYRNGIAEPIKYSVPIFSTEAAATAAGLQVLARINLRKK